MDYLGTGHLLKVISSDFITIREAAGQEVFFKEISGVVCLFWKPHPPLSENSVV